MAYADNQIIVVDHNICRQLVVHVPDTDVEYKPGKDVRGNKVAPADIEGSQVEIGSPSILFYLVQDLSELTGSKIPQDYPGLSQDMILGYVEIREGVAYLNGKPLGPEKNRELLYICRKIKSEKLVPEQKR
ncbi:hypothetical protein [Emcibacter sp.]|uniref:hypothetical protein n=1 Tax=Emcibacter sp. TaxID=1979954 RepID=UPI002AA8019F|nr:hypothetical protein [Emcibacter sp.]